MRLALSWIHELTIDLNSLKTQGRQHSGVRVQISTTPTTIPTLPILKCNNASRFFVFIYFFYCLHIVYPHWNDKVRRKIEIFFAFSTLRIFHTPHFPHSAFSTLHIFHTPHFPHPSFSTLRIFHTPHSSFSTEPEESTLFHTYSSTSLQDRRQIEIQQFYFPFPNLCCSICCVRLWTLWV